jgi:hypothetical protein
VEPLLERGLLARDATLRLFADREQLGDRQRELLSLYALSQWVRARD